MAPGTNIGAAHPMSIGSGEEQTEVMQEKTANDAAASLAHSRARTCVNLRSAGGRRGSARDGVELRRATRGNGVPRDGIGRGTAEANSAAGMLLAVIAGYASPL